MQEADDEYGYASAEDSDEAVDFGGGHNSDNDDADSIDHYNTDDDED